MINYTHDGLNPDYWYNEDTGFASVKPQGGSGNCNCDMSAVNKNTKDNKQQYKELASIQLVKESDTKYVFTNASGETTVIDLSSAGNDTYLESIEQDEDVIHFNMNNGIVLNLSASSLNNGDYVSDSKSITIGNSTTKSGSKTIDVNNDGVTIKQSDGSVTYDNGDKVETDKLYVADAIIEDSFEVVGVTVGNLNPGDEIEGGTTVIELLKRMLMKQVDCTAVLPTVSLSISPSTTPVEVGTTSNEVLTVTYTDGKFTGSSTSYGSAYSVNAGCKEGNVTYTYNSTSLTTTGGNSYTDSSRSIVEGNNTWTAKAAYGASTVTPKTNTGEDSTKKIAAGTTAAVSKTIVGQYKYFMGYINKLDASTVTASEIRALNAKTGWLTVNGTTTLSGTVYKSNGNSIVIACPNKYKLSSVVNGLGFEISANFKSTATVNAPIGGTATADYNVYMYPISNGATVEIKTITFVKA